MNIKRSTLSQSHSSHGQGIIQLLGCLGVIALLLSHGSDVPASGLLVADGGFGGRLEIKEQDVRVTINNGIAVTEVNQIFLNTEDRIVEALYTFPVPNGASVSNFSMIINGKEMIGEVVEKKRAREIYQSYKRTRRDPGLLEQVDYKTFEMRVFPIQPNAEQHIKITYYQQLDFDHDWATYIYPLATSTKGVIEKTTGKFALTLDVKSEIPVKEVVSASHGDEFVLVNHSPEYAQASMEITGGDLSRDVVIGFRTSRPRTGLDVITSRQPGEDGYFLMTLTSGEELEKANSGMDYVFVVDISGSMRDDGKLVLSQNAAKAFIGSLGPDDRYEVMTFNNAATMLFKKLTPVNDDARQQANEFLANQYARGGTDLRSAVTAAFQFKAEDRELNVVVLSDGMTEQREQKRLLSLMQNAPASSRVFCVGIGNEVNRPLMKQLAEDAGGLAAFISHGDDFQRQADAFRRKLVHPVATDLTITVDGVPITNVLPETLPNLYHGSPVRMIGRYTKPGLADVTVRGTVMGKPFKQTVSIELPEVDDANPQIDRIWAWFEVQKLLNDMRRTGNSQSMQDQIVTLCESHSIVSEYASFIVLENDSEYRRWKIQRRNATRIKRDRKAMAEVRRSLEELREKSMVSFDPDAAAQPDSQNSLPGLPARQEVDRSSNQTTASHAPAARQRDLDFSSNRTVPVSRPSKRSWRPNRSPSSGGGGAIDPITGLIAAGMAGAAAWRKRRQQQVAMPDNKLEV